MFCLVLHLTRHITRNFLGHGSFLGIFIYNHLQQEKKQGKVSGFYSWKLLNLGRFFPVFEKRHGILLNEGYLINSFFKSQFNYCPF